LLLCLSLASALHAAVIVSQPRNPDNAVNSQVMPDLPELSLFASDDFTLVGAYDLSALTVYGLEAGGSGENTAVTAEIWTATPGSLGAMMLHSFAGTQAGGDLSFNLTGTLLGPGSYWITAYVTRPSTAQGQWFWNFSANAVSGAEANVYNPGGGVGIGTGPFPVGSFLGVNPTDLAFTLEGDLAQAQIPEPSTCALTAGALAGLALLRRRR
jgi:hypothetical protein